MSCSINKTQIEENIKILQSRLSTIEEAISMYCRVLNCMKICPNAVKRALGADMVERDICPILKGLFSLESFRSDDHNLKVESLADVVSRNLRLLRVSADKIQSILQSVTRPKTLLEKAVLKVVEHSLPTDGLPVTLEIQIRNWPYNKLAETYQVIFGSNLLDRELNMMKDMVVVIEKKMISTEEILSNK